MNSLSLFSDESRQIKNDGVDFFVIGTIFCETDFVEKVNEDLIGIKKSFGYEKDYEVKWSKINGKNISLIKSIIKYVSESNFLSMRVLIATNKTEKNFHIVLPHEKFIIRMYVLLIEKIFLMKTFESVKRIELFIDNRNTHSRESTRRISQLLHEKASITKIIGKNVESNLYQLVQVIDIIIGATGYSRENRKESSNKVDVISYIKDCFKKRSLNTSSKMSEEKYNVFVWTGENSNNGKM